MVMCYIKNCKSKSVKGSSIRFFSFPKNKSVADEWLRYCRVDTDKRSDARVCSKHFLPTDYFKSLRHVLMNESPKKLTLKADAVPSLELETTNTEISVLIPMSQYTYLNDRITELEKKLQRHDELKKTYNNALKKLRQIYNPDLIRYFLTRDKPEDTVSANSSSSVCPKAYRHFRKTIGILPPTLSIRRGPPNKSMKTTEHIATRKTTN